MVDLAVFPHHIAAASFVSGLLLSEIRTEEHRLLADEGVTG